MKVCRYYIATNNARYVAYASSLKVAVNNLKKGGYIFPNSAIKNVKRELVYTY